MKCQQLSVLPHCAGQLCSAWQRWRVMLGLNPGQGHVHWSAPVAVTVVSLLQFIPPFLGSPLLLFHKTVLTASENWLKAQKNLSSLSCEGQSWTESTSMQALSSSICGLNREISRKALKVITVDKKGICCGSIAADTSTLRLCFFFFFF